MSAVLAAVCAFVAYFFGYRFYSRWLARRVFQLDSEFQTPAYRFEDGVDFVPTRPVVLFGHHYASIAGLAPMLGPAVAVFWGWLPALCWVVFGSLLIGCVHDFSALVLSARHDGKSIGSLCEDILGSKAKALFLALIFFGVSLAMGVFVYVLSLLFSWKEDFNPLALHESTTSFPEVALPSVGLMVLAMGAGWLLYVKKYRLFPVASVGFILFLGLIYMGFTWPTAGLDADSWPVQHQWIWILMAYAWAASVLPVWLLLQARDFLNSLLLVFGLGLMYCGFFMQNPSFDAPAINPHPRGAPPLVPFVFITIACGAASGFHSLVASGTTAKQLARETHARAIGYGGMIAESLLALLAVLACTTTLGGAQNWAKVYVHWTAVQSLGAKLGIFIRGAASFVGELGISIDLAVTLVAMVVVSFALTTLDSATRLLRFNLEEVGASLASQKGFSWCRWLCNRFVATTFACLAIAFFAFYEIEGKPAGLALWQIFGGTNQLIAGLALVTGAVYLKQKGRPVWPLAIPALYMVFMTLTALSMKTATFYNQNLWLLFGISLTLIGIGVGVLGMALKAFFQPLSESSG